MYSYPKEVIALLKEGNNGNPILSPVRAPSRAKNKCWKNRRKCFRWRARCEPDLWQRRSASDCRTAGYGGFSLRNYPVQPLKICKPKGFQRGQVSADNFHRRSRNCAFHSAILNQLSDIVSSAFAARISRAPPKIVSPIVPPAGHTSHHFRSTIWAVWYARSARCCAWRRLRSSSI
jgi:hypothetical protein